jgi:hypothetical protein
MRPLSDLRIILAVAGAGLVAAVGVAAAVTDAGPTGAAQTTASARNVAAHGRVAARGSVAARRTVAASGSVAAESHVAAQSHGASDGGAAYGNPAGHAFVPAAGRAVSTAHPNHVIGSGTPASCTSAAVVRAVAEGGVITFDCGRRPVTITMTATAKVVNTSRRIVLDGRGLVTLSGAGKNRILYMNTCDPKQKYTTTDCWQQHWPQLIVQNMRFEDAYSGVRETSTSSYGGGAIFAEGGQLKVVNSGFINNRCYKYGPDLGGAAIRALGMWPGSPVYVTDDTFQGGRCSNGGALSSIDATWAVYNSLFTANKTTGWGENPQKRGSPGGGSGGAIYTDGDNYNVLVDGTVMRDNDAPGGEGGAIFFVVDAGHGVLTIKYSTLHDNPAGGYQNAPGIFDDVDQVVTAPVVIHSTIN